MDLLSIAAIAAPISSGGIAAAIFLFRLGKNLGKMEDGMASRMQNIEDSMKIMAKEREEDGKNNREFRKEIYNVLKDHGERIARVETTPKSDKEGS